MNRKNTFFLSNDSSRTAFQPIEINRFEPKRRTPTTITFKASKAILSAETNKVEERLLDDSQQTRSLARDRLNWQPNEKTVCHRVSQENEPREQHPSNSSEHLRFQDCNSRSNSNCSGQHFFSEQVSCLMLSLAKQLNSSQPAVVCGSVDSKQSSIDSCSLSSTHHLNEHLLISDRHSPQILLGSQLPAGVCCVLSNKPIQCTSLNKSICNGQRRLSSDPENVKRINLELPNPSKKAKQKQRSRSQCSLQPHSDRSIVDTNDRLFNLNNQNNLNNNLNRLNNLTDQQITSLMSANQQANAVQLDNNPQFRSTRYDTVEEDGAENHVKLLAVDHLPSQMLLQENGDIVNLNQSRLIKTSLLKQKFSNKNKTSQQPVTNGDHQQISAISHLPNQVNSGFTFVANPKFGVLNRSQSKSDCSVSDCNNHEINNNRSSVCLECENTKKMLQSNYVQLTPKNIRQSGSTLNSNTSPLSVQISPLSAAFSAHSTCSGQPNSALPSGSIQTGCLPIEIALINATQSVPITSSNNATTGNVFNFDPATIQQYAISLNSSLNQPAKLIKLDEKLQQQSGERDLVHAFGKQLIDDNLMNSLRLQERATSSLSGIASDPLSMASQQQMTGKIHGNLPSVRNASSCSQYNVLPNAIQGYNPTTIDQPDQFQPSASAIHSQSEQNLVSSKRFYNNLNNHHNFAADRLAPISQPQFYSQQHVYSRSPTAGQLIEDPQANLNQNINSQIGNFSRPVRLNFRNLSPTLLTTSSLADSNLESPSQTYVDNNDSVNIFNKYQTTSSSNYFYTGPKEHDFFRKAVPTLPIIIAILLCILNWFLPGSGTILSSFTVLLGCKTEYGENWKSAFFLNLLAGLLQFLTAIIVVGWVWSVMTGVSMIKNATKKRNKELLISFT